MKEGDKVFTGSIPQIYDDYLVPLIFEDYANDMAARVANLNPNSVLETAAGSGVVTRALAPLLPAGASYTVTDLNQAMLDQAAERQASAAITWQSADALNLPFEDNVFDAVCCQFGVMFYPDKHAGYQQVARVLKPGGCYVFNVWDHIGENEFADVVTQALAELYPDSPPQFMARIPHGYSDTDQIRQELLTAGFLSVEIETKASRSVAFTPAGPAIAYCQGTPLRNEILDRDPDGLDRATRHAAKRIEERFGPGAVSGKIQGHVITARV